MRASETQNDVTRPFPKLHYRDDYRKLVSIHIHIIRTRSDGIYTMFFKTQTQAQIHFVAQRTHSLSYHSHRFFDKIREMPERMGDGERERERERVDAKDKNEKANVEKETKSEGNRKKRIRAIN